MRRRTPSRWCRRAGVAVGVLSTVLVLAAFPLGPLFPWSPWKPGFDVVASARADVYYGAGSSLPPGFEHVDEDVAEAEALYGLRASSRLTVVLCRSWGDFRRFLPIYRGRGIGAAALQTGNAIYVSPRVAERGFDHREFLRHEISHAVMHQNQAIWDAARTGRAEWFFEGLAVSFGRQRAFVTLDEASEHIRAHDVRPLFERADRESGAPRNMRLNYQVWRLFAEYVQGRGGQERFRRLLRMTMEDPEGCERHLASVYGVPLDAMLREFREAIRLGRWHPTNR